MVSQILNFGLPAQIDIQVVGNAVPAKSRHRRANDAGDRADPRHHRPAHPAALSTCPTGPSTSIVPAPSRVGYSQHDVAADVLTSLSGSFQTSPTFYLNPQNHVSYNIAVQTPQYDVQNLQPAAELSIAPTARPGPRRFWQHRIHRSRSRTRHSQPLHARPVIDIYGSVEGTDLATVAAKVDRIVKKYEKNPPRGTEFFVRGQIQTMRTSFVGLVSGLLFSIVLVYALIVVNFQSWLDPFIIIAACRVRSPASSGCSSSPTPTSACRAHRRHHVRRVATANSILVVSSPRSRWSLA